MKNPTKYDIPDETAGMVSESLSVATYGNAVTSQLPYLNVSTESPNAKKKEFLKTHLHSSTVRHLQSVDWMENKPFPMYSDSDNDEAWIDMAEATDCADVVDDAIVNKDRQAWQSLR